MQALSCFLSDTMLSCPRGPTVKLNCPPGRRDRLEDTAGFPGVTTINRARSWRVSLSDWLGALYPFASSWLIREKIGSSGDSTRATR